MPAPAAHVAARQPALDVTPHPVSASPIGSISKMYPEFDHLRLFPLSKQVQAPSLVCVIPSLLCVIEQAFPLLSSPAPVSLQSVHNAAAD